MPAAMPPDCEISARSPGGARRDAKVALSLAAGSIRPMQFGPTRRSPLARAALAVASAIEPGPWPRPAVMMTAAAQPASAACAMTVGTTAGGVATIAMSGAAGRAASVGTARTPSISAKSGLTRWIGPAKPPSRMLRSTIRPSDFSRGLPPTSAADFGRNSWSRR
jgi:hypothetical protein